MTESTVMPWKASMLLPIAGIIGLCFVATAPAGAWPGHRTVMVPPPNGIDDTMAIQSALDQCVTLGPHCTVQLATGTYHTGYVMVRGFDGTFRGRGMRLTEIQPLPSLPCTVSDDFVTMPTPPDQKDSIWPDLMIFLDGNLTLSDMTFRVLAEQPTQLWTLFGMEFHELISAVRVQTTDHPMNVTIERIKVEGVEVPGSVFGFNLINGVIIAGEQPRPDAVGGQENWGSDRYPFTGRIVVRSSIFKNCLSADAFSHHVGSQISLSRNTWDNVAYGVELGNVEDSWVDAADSRGTVREFGVILYNPYFAPEKVSHFAIRRNNIRVSGPAATAGVGLFDNAEGAKVQDVVITNNWIEGQGLAAAGIFASSTQGTRAWGNRIFGSGNAGILVSGASRCALLWNRVGDFTPDAARVLLDENTTQCLVVGGYDQGDVLDLGVDNHVVGIGQ